MFFNSIQSFGSPLALTSFTTRVGSSAADAVDAVSGATAVSNGTMSARDVTKTVDGRRNLLIE